MIVEPDWLVNFDVTRDDLQRLKDWLNELKRGVTLEELTRRIISGRLRYGRDESPSALPAWVQEKHVLSWDEEEKWCEGCQVLVARRLNNQILPFFGIIIKVGEKYFDIKIDKQTVTYTRVEAGSTEARLFYDNVKKSIWEREKQQLAQSTTTSIDEQTDLILLKQGADIASQIRNAIENDKRFIQTNHLWYLQEWIPDVHKNDLVKAHRGLRKTARHVNFQQLTEQFPDLPQGGIGEIALMQAIATVPDLFQPTDDGWQVIPPPPPPWDQAIGLYYVYDPQTYEILLRPGQDLKKKAAERLMELGFYADVVETKS